MEKVTALCAVGLALVLIGLQIVLGLEYTAGGSFGTQASMVTGMLTLALLPVFIEVARRSGHRAIAGALFVAFGAFLWYSLPATTGRTGEIRETKVAAAADVAKVRDDLERTTKMADWARQDWVTECGSGEGKKCRAKRNTVEALEDRRTMLEAKIKAAGATPGDLGSETWAWASAGTVSAATIRRSSVIAFAIGLDVAIWALIWLATSMLIGKEETVAIKPAANDTAQTSFPVPPNGGNRRPAYTRAAASADVVQLVARGQQIPSQETLSERWGVPKGTVSKWLRRFEGEGLIQRETVGRCKMVAAA